MNLLTLKNRFANNTATYIDLANMLGYQQALEDLYRYLEHKTDGFHKSHRLIDVKDLLETFSETNIKMLAIVDETRATIRRGKEDPDDIKNIL